MRRTIFAAILVLTATAHADCMPPLNPMNIAASSNPRGDWIGWWCPGQPLPYVAACPKTICSYVGSKRAVAAWLRAPSLEVLRFGVDPHTDPALRAVWEPERAMLDAVKPDQ